MADSETIKTDSTGEEAKTPEQLAAEAEAASKAEKRTTEALDILDILEDPVRNKAFVENLARQAGFLKPPETKAEEKTQRKSARDFMKAHLGDDYKLVAEKLGDALEELFESRMAEVNGRFESLTKNSSERAFASDFDSFVSENTVTEEEAGQILKQLDIMSPNPNVPLKKFLGQQLELVRFRSGKQTGDKEKLKRQAENFGRRAESTGSNAGEKTVQHPKSFSIRDAVAAASRGEKWGN